MSKRKPMDKAQARERRNQLLESAASADLSLTEGVREMRAIAGMTQDEFAQHRGVSARVIKAIELGQGNPTVATLNRIGEFFGLQIGFVPIKRTGTKHTDGESTSTTEGITVETIMAGKKALDEYFDKLAAYVAGHGDLMARADNLLELENMPQWEKSKPSRPAKAASNKKKNRTS
jgi:DNA-binding XRE family transcriptional regulator